MKKIKLLEFVSSKYKNYTTKEVYSKILCGRVFINSERIRDPKRLIDLESDIEIREKKFVSRGGEKLFFAIQEWGIDVKNRVFIDAGCSTGGFTDCLLKNGASHVYAVDVGKNQLDYSIRSDRRVTAIERTNIMSLNKFNIIPDAGVIDISFRSVVGVVSHILSIIKEKWIIALIKPQFEWKNPDKNFNGVIRDKSILLEVMEGVVDSLYRENVCIKNVLLSPVRGRKGNNEFLFYITDRKHFLKDKLIKNISSIIERIPV